jgi:Acyl-CoA reductase (LuxC)
MNLQQRILLLAQLGEYMKSSDEEWQLAKQTAGAANGWFTPTFVELACHNIVTAFLQKNILENFTEKYVLQQQTSKTIGLVMAGNIPLVGFHDMLCVFLSGHKALIKCSSKDDVLLPHLVKKMCEWNRAVTTFIAFADMLKNCDAYIATGSNNTSRYFEYYFAKYPHIIRKNRTSVAILNGNETAKALELLADDMHVYYGLGCRNVTKLFVPTQYDFLPLVNAMKKYVYFMEYNKYKNNYDYRLAILLLNNKYYMSSGATLLVEDEQLFSPIGQVNYSYYTSLTTLEKQLQNNNNIQCMAGKNHTAFGIAQTPAIHEFADGVDTMSFLTEL